MTMNDTSQIDVTVQQKQVGNASTHPLLGQLHVLPNTVFCFWYSSGENKVI